MSDKDIDDVRRLSYSMNLWLPLALLIATPALAQNKAVLPFPGTNEIAVQLPDSGIVAWRRADRLLVAAGYQFQVKDSVSLQLLTAPRPLAMDPYRLLILRVIVMGHTALLTGRVNLAHKPTLSVPVHYRQRSSPSNGDQGIGWKELVAAARAFNGTLVYLRRP